MGTPLARNCMDAGRLEPAAVTVGGEGATDVEDDASYRHIGVYDGLVASAGLPGDTPCCKVSARLRGVHEGQYPQESVLLSSWPAQTFQVM